MALRSSTSKRQPAQQVHDPFDNNDEEVKQVPATMPGSGNNHIDVNAKRAFGYNQNSSCIAIGTNSGFRVFMSDPLECKFERGGFQDIKIA